jgi:hypothetical protein
MATKNDLIDLIDKPDGSVKEERDASPPRASKPSMVRSRLMAKLRNAAWFRKMSSTSDAQQDHADGSDNSYFSERFQAPDTFHASGKYQIADRFQDPVDHDRAFTARSRRHQSTNGYPTHGRSPTPFIFDYRQPTYYHSTYNDSHMPPTSAPIFLDRNFGPSSSKHRRQRPHGAPSSIKRSAAFDERGRRSVGFVAPASRPRAFDQARSTSFDYSSPAEERMTSYSASVARVFKDAYLAVSLVPQQPQFEKASTGDSAGHRQRSRSKSKASAARHASNQPSKMAPVAVMHAPNGITSCIRPAAQSSHKMSRAELNAQFRLSLQEIVRESKAFVLPQLQSRNANTILAQIRHVETISGRCRCCPAL